jgi:hypothetical protein
MELVFLDHFESKLQCWYEVHPSGVGIAVAAALVVYILWGLFQKK